MEKCLKSEHSKEKGCKCSRYYKSSFRKRRRGKTNFLWIEEESSWTNSADEKVDEWRHYRFQFFATSLQTISITEVTVLWSVMRNTAADRYSYITSTVFPLFYIATFTAGLTSFTVLLQLLRQQTNPGTSAAPPAETHWSKFTLPTSDISPGSVTLPAAQIGDFVEILQLQVGR
jgi:hypothetical protein